jgi:hypothetical protein
VVLYSKVGLYQFTNNVESVSIKKFSEAGPQIGLRLYTKRNIQAFSGSQEYDPNNFDWD